MPSLKTFREEKFNTVATLYIHSIDIFIIFSIFLGSEELLMRGLVMFPMGLFEPEKKIVDELSVKRDARGNVQIPKMYAAGGWLHT